MPIYQYQYHPPGGGRGRGNPCNRGARWGRKERPQVEFLKKCAHDFRTTFGILKNEMHPCIGNPVLKDMTGRIYPNGQVLRSESRPMGPDALFLFVAIPCKRRMLHAMNSSRSNAKTKALLIPQWLTTQPRSVHHRSAQHQHGCSNSCNAEDARRHQDIKRSSRRRVQTSNSRAAGNTAIISTIVTTIPILSNHDQCLWNAFSFGRVLPPHKGAPSDNIAAQAESPSRAAQWLVGARSTLSTQSRTSRRVLLLDFDQESGVSLSTGGSGAGSAITNLFL